MPHTNPTLIAETQVLDSAHPSSRVGRGGPQNQPIENAFLDRLVMVRQHSEEMALISNDLTQAERVQLSEMARLSLEEEIALMRKGIKSFAKASEGVKDGKSYNKDMGEVLNLLGLSCYRVAGLMRVQLLLQGPQSAGLLEDLIDAMSDFVEKMTAEEGAQND
ncbi:MAG: hypothetical protein GX768_05015 [Chloroflexi bacterium]|nr:hypothetical protein [Chloroflexota bacterium]